MDYELIGFGAVMLVTLVMGTALASSPRNPFPRRLVLIAVVLRIVGALARYDMIRLFYGGVADASRYYHSGLEVAERIWSLDSGVFTYDFWFGGPGRWWGTPFMGKVAGVVLTFVGPSFRGAYLAFSMMAFAGLYLTALTVYRRNPGPGAVRFAAWIWLWPSLWFWPSSIGKEAVTVFAVGLVTFGYASRGARIRWLPFLAGLAIAFALRPHVAAVLALATAGAYWLQSWQRPSPRRILEAIAAAALSLVLLNAMASQFGLEDADLEGVQEFVSYRGGQTLAGGSSLGDRPSGVLGVPLAFVNTWMRPFPWDVHNVTSLFSAVEILFLWYFVWKKRKWLKVALKRWWRNRLLAFGVPLLAGYTLMIGITFGNLGIIARQRSPLFPLVFMLLTAAGATRLRRRRRVPAPAPLDRARAGRDLPAAARQRLTAGRQGLSRAPGPPLAER